MNNKDRGSIVSSLIELIEQSKLNINQRTQIIEIIENLNIATETQKERFLMYYGLNKNGTKSKNFTEISKLYGCTPSAIRLSVVTVKNKLSRLNKEFEILEKIVNSFEN